MKILELSFAKGGEKIKCEFLVAISITRGSERADGNFHSTMTVRRYRGHLNKRSNALFISFQIDGNLFNILFASVLKIKIDRYAN